MFFTETKHKRFRSDTFRNLQASVLQRKNCCTVLP